MMTELSKVSGIYEILNAVNGKLYIGSTVDLHKRFGAHKNSLNAGTHANTHLQSSWNKYGAEAFHFFPIEFCSPEDLLKKEQFWMDGCKARYAKHGYNMCPTAGSMLGTKHTKESRLKMSLAHIGNEVTPETRNKISKTAKGRKCAEGTRLKNSLSQLGSSNSMYGKTGAEHGRSRMVEFDGKTQNTTAWAKELGISHRSLGRRLERWPLEKALTEPKSVGCPDSTKEKISAALTRYITFNGVTKSMEEWAQQIGIHKSSLRERLLTWSVEKALTTPKLKCKRVIP